MKCKEIGEMECMKNLNNGLYEICKNGVYEKDKNLRV